MKQPLRWKWPTCSAAMFAVALLLILGPAGARAELQVDITRGHVEPLPIAIADFYGANPGEAERGRSISRVISNNLKRSGLFRPVDRDAFIQQTQELAAVQKGQAKVVRPRFRDWRIINVQALVTGRVSADEEDRLTVEFLLWDVFAEQHLVALTLSGSDTIWRRMAHKISDSIYQRLTGESGYFDSRIVYIAETGPPDSRVKRLAIMDQDGENMRFLSDGRHLVLTPRFSPTAQRIAYLSYEGGVARVYMRDVAGGREQLLGDFPGMTFAPRFSPEGDRVVVTLAREGNSDIYEMDLGTGEMARLTRDPAIQTAPSYSPDGKFIVFESDHGGDQQIYVMRRDGSRAERITFGEGRYGTPVWSPRGDLIAFTKSHRGTFSIGVMKPDGTGERILSQDFLVEGPTWAPNGRVLMFFRQTSREPDSAELVTIDLTGRNERILFTTTAASDPAWSPLIP